MIHKQEGNFRLVSRTNVSGKVVYVVRGPLGGLYVFETATGRHQTSWASKFEMLSYFSASVMTEEQFARAEWRSCGDPECGCDPNGWNVLVVAA